MSSIDQQDKENIHINNGGEEEANTTPTKVSNRTVQDSKNLALYFPDNNGQISGRYGIDYNTTPTKVSNSNPGTDCTTPVTAVVRQAGLPDEVAVKLKDNDLTPSILRLVTRDDFTRAGLTVGQSIKIQRSLNFLDTIQEEEEMDDDLQESSGKARKQPATVTMAISDITTNSVENTMDLKVQKILEDQGARLKEKRDLSISADTYKKRIHIINMYNTYIAKSQDPNAPEDAFNKHTPDMILSASATYFLNGPEGSDHRGSTRRTGLQTIIAILKEMNLETSSEVSKFAKGVLTFLNNLEMRDRARGLSNAYVAITFTDTLHLINSSLLAYHGSTCLLALTMTLL